MDAQWAGVVVSSVSGLGSVVVAALALWFAIQAAQREHQGAVRTVLEEVERTRLERIRRERLELLLELSREVARVLARDATETGVAAAKRATLLLAALPPEEFPWTRAMVNPRMFQDAEPMLTARGQSSLNATIDEHDTQVIDELAEAIARVAVPKRTR